jgi:hypothetical protein
MDFLEKKLIEIIQFNTDHLKSDENLAENDEMKFKAILDKVAGKLY